MSLLSLLTPRKKAERCVMPLLGKLIPVSGIYHITCLTNGKVYIGQSFNVMPRLMHHTDLLVSGKHNVKSLQEDFNKYGIDCFSFGIIAECPKEELLDLETRVIANLRVSGLTLYNRSKQGFFELYILSMREEERCQTMETMKQNGTWPRSVAGYDTSKK
jgi:group I intron endonuclease